MPYIMRTENDCGPAALVAATSRSYEEIMAAWPSRFLGNDDDSPWHHDGCLAKLEIPRRIVTCGEILDCKCPTDRTIILLHALNNPYLTQHWAVLAAVDPLTQRVSIHMGDGESPRAFSFDTFTKLYAGGAPACAYVVGEGDVPRLSWYKRLYLVITRAPWRWF